jgi:hypothetical protein
MGVTVDETMLCSSIERALLLPDEAYWQYLWLLPFFAEHAPHGGVSVGTSAEEGFTNETFLGESGFF